MSVMHRTHKEMDPNKPWSKLDFLGGGSEEEFDGTLFEDPTGSMKLGDAEELSTEEMEHRVKMFATKYDPVVFSSVFLPIVDIIELMLRHRLVPSIRPEVALTRWFTDPLLVLADSSRIAGSMGEDRWAKYKEIIADLSEELLPTSPIYRMAKRYDVSPEIAVPLFRQLGAEVAFLTEKKQSSALQQIPQFVLSLNGNKAPAALNLPADQQRRTKCVADLLLATAQEVGQPLLGFIGLQLVQAASIGADYTMQKRLTNVFTSAQRISTDWNLRSTGRLLQAFPSWVHGYFKLLRDDNVKLQLEGFIMETYMPTPEDGVATSSSEGNSTSSVEDTADEESNVFGASDDGLVDSPTVAGLLPEPPALTSATGTSVGSYFAKPSSSSTTFFHADELEKIIKTAAAKRMTVKSATDVVKSRHSLTEGSIDKSLRVLKEKSRKKQK
jgi:hypothetical protein